MIRATAALCMVFLFCASYSVYLSQWQATVIGFHQWLWRDCHVYILEHTSTPVRIRNLSREPSRGSSLPTSLLSHPFLLYFLFTQQVSLGLRSCRHHSLLTGGYSHFTDARWLRYLQKKKSQETRQAAVTAYYHTSFSQRPPPLLQKTLSVTLDASLLLTDWVRALCLIGTWGVRRSQNGLHRG